MVVDKREQRIEVLLDWREHASAAGHRVPSTADLMNIGSANDSLPAGVDQATCEPWRQTIDFLLMQVKASVLDPVEQLPDRLRVPAGGTSARSPSSPTPAPAPPTRPTSPSGVPQSGGTDRNTRREEVERIVAALVAWRDREFARNPSEGRSLKEGVLRTMVRAGALTEQDIRQRLPEKLRHLAPRMAEVMRSAGAVDDRPASRPPSAPPVASTPAPPAAVPAPSPPSVRRAETLEPAGPHAALDLRPEDLADWSNTPASRMPATTRTRAVDDGVSLTWPQWPGPEPFVIFRVVSADGDYPPPSPQDADPLVLTRDTSCVDAREHEAAVRHLQVWCHAGTSRDEAANADPVLHARCTVVAAVAGAHVACDGPTVVGAWRVPPGVTAVRVSRTPMREPSSGGGPAGASQQIRPQEPLLGGFEDPDVARGRLYAYRLQAEALVDGGPQLSRPVQHEVRIPAVLEPVTDLVATPRPGDPNLMDLSWTPPSAGEVRIYRNEQGPLAGAGERARGVGDLTELGLVETDWLRRPVSEAQGRAQMAGVPWPDGWSRAYLTPVTVVGDLVRVGRAVPSLRLGPVLDAAIVERTHYQALTFGWPEGATIVLAFQTLTGQDASARRDSEEITQERYRRHGVFHLSRPLPEPGCSLHLVPAAFTAGQRVEGPPVTLVYPGQVRLRYTLYTHRDRAGRPQSVAVQIVSTVESGGAPLFTLTHRQDRLPLHAADGAPVPVRSSQDPQGQPQTHFRPPGLFHVPGDLVWTAPITGLAGYLRLFVVLEPDMQWSVSLEDPPVATLRVEPDAARRVGR